jgi:hypothetical protein
MYDLMIDVEQTCLVGRPTQVQELEAAREQKASEGKSLAVLIQEKNKAAGYEVCVCVCGRCVWPYA